MKSRYLASISLAIMASGFVATLFLPKSTLVYLLQGGFEAGLVGGIADWFAVTALFRHPLGIPIPHTSLLLKNRNRIIQSLISAMENEFLNKESIENKLRKLNVLQYAGSLLTRLLSKRKVRRGALNLLIQLIERLPLDRAVPYIQSGITAYIRKFDIKSAADTVLTKIMNDRYDEKALDYALDEGAKWAGRPETGMMLGKLASEKLNELKVGGFMGFAVQAFAGFMNEEKMGVMLQNLLLSSIRELKNEDNAYREKFIREIRVQLFELAGNEARLDGVKEWALNQLQGEGAESFVQERIEEIRSAILRKLEEEQAGGGRAVFTAYRTAVRYVSQQPGWVAAWESRLMSAIISFVESNHYRIGQLVKENLDRMDDASLVRMLEEKLGNDLQWIRVNGALCGFIVGIILSLIQL
ncbi:hypothetical protein PAECIP111893_04242 [Paenibacillus plantiphilus]|uniref:DUF445 domain-containing protein n=1 Tax=Paenibacillus plantiphilus TaxID=2905650 RepID=A0ABN8GUJ7_9BACL|nr:DUF445 domain-containing protein [Paenibacillus plantiphilus]CAH1217250.1 hypothetical protein PAECIP111893_04242 [Paenibacillus plantiphilus]